MTRRKDLLVLVKASSSGRIHLTLVSTNCFSQWLAAQVPGLRQVSLLDEENLGGLRRQAEIRRLPKKGEYSPSTTTILGAKDMVVVLRLIHS